MKDESLVGEVTAWGGHPMPLKTLVDGVVLENEISQVRWQSMPDYLNFETRPLKNAFHQPQEAHKSKESWHTRPAKVTLSDILQSEDSHGSSDFGWFTPSVNSLGSLDDLNSLGAEIADDSFVLPMDAGAPGAYNPKDDHLASARDGEFSSSTNTAVLSPCSTVKTSREACTSSLREDDLIKDNTVRLKTTRANEDSGGTAVVRSASCTTGASGEGCNDGGARNDAARIGGGRVRALPLRSTKRASMNRMPEINQWHTIHRGASSIGALAAGIDGGGSCKLHLRRASFPLSTRHFPESTNPVSEPLGSSSQSRENNRRSSSKSPSPVLGNSSRTGAPSTIQRQSVRLTERGSPALSDRAARRAEEFNAAAGGDAPVRGRGNGGGLFGSASTAEHQPPLRKVTPKSYAWALTEIRVVDGGSPWDPPRAEYLVVACLGQGKLVAGWRRASDFARLAKVARRYWMSKVIEVEMLLKGLGKSSMYVLNERFVQRNAGGFIFV